MLISGGREEHASAALARVDALHTGLTQIVLEGGNLDGIAAEVSRVLGVGIAFTSTDGRVQARALAPELEDALAEHHSPTRPAGSGSSGSTVPAPPSVRARCGSRAWPPAAPTWAGWCALRADEPITADDVHALERAAAVAALLMTREAAVAAVETSTRATSWVTCCCAAAVGRRLRRTSPSTPTPSAGTSAGRWSSWSPRPTRRTPPPIL